MYDTRNSPNVIERIIRGQNRALANANVWLKMAEALLTIGDWEGASVFFRQACYELQATPWKCMGRQ